MAQRQFGYKSDIPLDIPLTVSLLIAILSVSAFMYCIARWDTLMGPGQDKFGIPYYVQALLFSSFIGSVSGITAAIGMNEAIFGSISKNLAGAHFVFKNYLAYFLQVLVAGLIVLQIIFSNKVKKKNKAVINSAS
jgi:hypothetical protein